MSRAFEVVRRQNALFDGYEIIDSAFMPLAGRQLVASFQADVEVEQGELQF